MPQYAERYYEQLTELVERVFVAQREKISATAALFADAIMEKRTIWSFGCTHASMMAAELYYRAGGLIPIQGIFGPGLWLDQLPVTRTSELEKLEGYGRVILADLPLKAGDVLMVASTSGKNAVPVEVALEGKARGLSIVALTSIPYSSTVEPNHSSGRRLLEIADIILDNGAPKGDALMAYPEFPHFSGRVGAASTVSGALLLNAIVVETVGLLLQAGHKPPVYVSGNVEGGMEANRKAMAESRGQGE